MNFILLFIQNRGNQTDVEKALGVSYQTIRGKLDEIVRLVTTAPTASPRPHPPAPAADRRREILSRIADGKMGATEGLAALRESQNQAARA